MKRYPHYWWKTRGAYCPSRIAVLDCDTAPATAGISGQPCPDRVIRWHLTSVVMRRGLPGNRHRESGEDLTGLWGNLSSLCLRRETCWLFIPGAIRVLTAVGFWDRLENGSIRLDGNDWRVDRGNGSSGEDKTSGLCCIENPPTMVLCRFADMAGKLLILDTRNYGIESEPGTGSVQGRADATLHGLLSIVRTLREDTPVSLRGTAASQAMQILRTRHDVVRLHCHTNPDATALERAAYHGGRVECYRTGEVEGPVWHLDVKSMYPSVCLTLPIPVSLREYTSEPATAERLVRKCPGEVCAAVCLREGGAEFPVRNDGGTSYPEGPVQTTLAGPELQRALGRGVIERVSDAARYSCAPALAGFYQWGIGVLRDMRMDENRVCMQWVKRVLNALIGKLGEPGRRWVPCPMVPGHGPYAEFTYPGPDGIETRHRHIAWNGQRQETHGESYWSMPAVAAFVCAAARVRLWHILSCAGRENVWYVDTDGILCNGVAREKLLSVGLVRDNEIGYLREVACYDRVHIHGIRHYEYDGGIKCSGVANGEIRAGETREDYWNRHPEAPTSALGYIRRVKGG